MKEQGIEEIFKSAFNNFETDVDPNVWTNVQSRIGGTSATHPNNGANGSVAGKAGVKAIIAIVTAVTGVTVGTYFLMTDSHSKKAVAPSAQSASPTVQVVPQQQAPVNDEKNVTNTTSSSQIIKTAPEQSLKSAEKVVAASSISSASTPQTSVSSSTPVKAVVINTPPVATPPVATKPAPIAPSNSPTPSTSELPKTTEAPASPENHTYQNDFADINNYLEPEAGSGKAALQNIFTPNGDGKNDVFTLKTKNLKSLVVTVFDQTGKLIYQWSNLDGSWDGNLSDGHPAPEGMYYYSLLAETLDGKQCIDKNTLILKRYR